MVATMIPKGMAHEEYFGSKVENPHKYRDYSYIYFRIYDADTGVMRVNERVRHSLVFRYCEVIGQALWENDICLLQHPIEQYPYGQLLPDGRIIRYSNGYDIFKRTTYKNEYVERQRPFHTITLPGDIVTRM